MQVYILYNVFQGINAALMLLPIVNSIIPVKDKGPAKKHWVGANGEWIAFVQHPGRWYMENVYTMVAIDLPHVDRVSIYPLEHQWYPYISCPPPPLTYEYHQRCFDLLKIQITSKPFMRDLEWQYSAIAVFDKFIAIIHRMRDSDWIILRNDYLAPTKYVDVVGLSMGHYEEHIFTVTKPRGDVLL
jgi:hypothetical protein